MWLVQEIKLNNNLRNVTVKLEMQNSAMTKSDNATERHPKLWQKFSPAHSFHYFFVLFFIFLFFFRLNQFTTAQVPNISAVTIHVFEHFSTVQIYRLSYNHLQCWTKQIDARLARTLEMIHKPGGFRSVANIPYVNCMLTMVWHMITLYELKE